MSDDVLRFWEECDVSLVCEFSRACFQNIQCRSFFFTEIFLVLIIDKLRTKYILYESYDGYPKYFLFAPSHSAVVVPKILKTYVTTL